MEFQGYPFLLKKNHGDIHTISNLVSAPSTWLMDYFLLTFISYRETPTIYKPLHFYSQYLREASISAPLFQGNSRILYINDVRI